MSGSETPQGVDPPPLPPEPTRAGSTARPTPATPAAATVGPPHASADQPTTNVTNVTYNWSIGQHFGDAPAMGRREFRGRTEDYV